MIILYFVMLLTMLFGLPAVIVFLEERRRNKRHLEIKEELNKLKQELEKLNAKNESRT